MAQRTAALHVEPFARREGHDLGGEAVPQLAFAAAKDGPSCPLYFQYAARYG